MSLHLLCYACARPEEIGASIALLRSRRSDLFIGNHRLYDPDSMSELERSLGAGLGIVAESTIFVGMNPSHAEERQQLVDAIYDCLGKDRVVVTSQGEEIIPFSGMTDFELRVYTLGMRFCSRLKRDRLDFALSYIQHHELLMALDTLCTYLCEDAVRITHEEHCKIVAISRLDGMALHPILLKALSKLVAS
jgi:hypothetical protein